MLFDVVWMAHTEMAAKGIFLAKGLLLYTQMIVQLLLVRVVDGILVSCEIIGSREVGVTGLSY